MFGSKKAKLAPNGEIETIVGKDTQLKGALKAKGTIRIDGDFEGDIDSEHDIIIGESGSVSARINARNVMISGLMKGNIQATGCLELMASGRLYGDIKANVLIVGEGAVFKGASDMADGGNSASYQDEIVSV
ncbi:polymer-forming cytoskeletal protein|uniref:Protein CcmA, bactofilin family n=2 Tax=Dendrosporobacter quercicolus TaxID=146817 RepID=A0A1G9XXL8_9FIRM|nr:polymer-forming cytoskeletal protein [Dendrosporobacter quercicolus DSM 1736]SDN01271.1 protein CcmA, bactofilin family [Dendrosporobacter quercicolus]